jgi:hypothetical protein
MADATTQLDRIATLVDKLTPVADKQRGMRIEADDWNTLVDVALGILQLDRLQELRTGNLLEERFAAKDHEHLGEVSIAWLDADLQSRLGGANATVSTRQALADMDQKVRALSAEVNRLSTLVATSQKSLDDTQVREVDRSKALLDFDRRFKGVEDMKTLVTTLSGDVTSIRTNVDKVLDLRRSLQDAAGNPIDVVQIGQDVADLKLLRANLNGADGQPIRLRDIESKIQDIANVVGTGAAGGLDGRLAVLSASIQDSVNAKTQTLVTDSQNSLRGEIVASETRMRSEVQAASIQTRDTVQQQFSAQIDATETKFNAALATSIAAQAADVRQDALSATNSLLNQRLAEVPDQVRAQVATAVNALGATLAGNLQVSLAASVASTVKDVQTQLDQQITSIQASTTALTQSISGLVADQVADALPGLQATLTQSVTDQTVAARQAIEASLGATVASSVAGALQNLDARIATAVGQQTASIGGKVTDAVKEATKTFPDQISGEVKLQIAAANIDGKLQDSAKSLTTQLRAEMKSAFADQDARTSTSIQGAVTLLQGQLASAVSAAVKESEEFSTAQNSSLRTELNKTIDVKIKDTRDSLVTDFNSRVQVSHDQLTADFQSQIRSVNESVATQIRGQQTRIGGTVVTDTSSVIIR